MRVCILNTWHGAGPGGGEGGGTCYPKRAIEIKLTLKQRLPRSREDAEVLQRADEGHGHQQEEEHLTELEQVVTRRRPHRLLVLPETSIGQGLSYESTVALMILNYVVLKEQIVESPVVRARGMPVCEVHSCVTQL